jgi:hypothetical protein
MTVINLKTWKLDNGVYVSPRYPEFSAFNRSKRFFIRAQVTIHCDEISRVIKIPTREKVGKANLEILRQLKLIEL